MRRYFGMMAIAAIGAMAAACGTNENTQKLPGTDDDTIVIVNDAKEVLAPNQDTGVDSLVKDFTPGKVVQLSQSDYAARIANYKADPRKYLGTEPAIVDFWAEWCGPCQRLNPVLKRVAERTGLTIYKVNVDQAEELCSVYGIQAIPTLFVCYQGQVRQFDGVPDEATLMQIATTLVGLKE